MKNDLLTRRNVLQAAGGIIAAAALPAKAATTAPAISPIMTKLSAYMSSAAGHALPAEVVEKTKHLILDTLAAMI
jgi:hypothetical protein